jgi:hypothetical protein
MTYGRGWRAKVDLSILSDESLAVDARAHAGIDTLTKNMRVFAECGIENIILHMRAACDATDWDAFDDALDLLYAVADRERVWLG